MMSGPCLAGLKHGVGVADIGRRRHAHAANQACREIGEDVAEHVLHHHDVVANVARMSEAISGLTSRPISRMSLHSCGQLAIFTFYLPTCEGDERDGRRTELHRRNPHAVAVTHQVETDCGR